MAVVARPVTRGTRRMLGLAPLLAALGLSAASGACTLDNPGVRPPHGVLAYPVALTLSAARTAEDEPRFLYVANSNFDIRYNAGSVQTYDVHSIIAAIDANGCRRLALPNVKLSDGGTVEVPFLPLHDAGSLESDAGVDGGLLDAGADAGTDAGASDGGASDAGASDAGATDGGASDGGASDGGAPQDAGPGADAGAGMDAGLDAGAGDDGPSGVTLPPGYENASAYGTLRGILCDDRDSEGTQCCFSENEKFLVDELHIDSFATGLAMRTLTKTKGERLYVPIRSRGDLLYIDANEKGELSCGPGEGRCQRAADGSNEDAPDESLAPSPTALVLGKLAGLGVDDATRGERVFIATAHDQGQLSLFVEPGPDQAPLLQDVAPTSQLRATSVTLNPAERLLYVTSAARYYAQRYAIRTHAATPGGENAKRELLVPSTPLAVSGTSDLSSTSDLRDFLVDSEDPTLLYALVRGLQQSVAFLRRDGTTSSSARIIQLTRVGNGPSKLELATLGGRRVLLVSCYDARSIFIIDVSSRQIIEVVRGLSGPFNMAIDEAQQLMFVADFGASVLRVVDLEGVADRSKPPPRIIATLGEPHFAGGYN